jgi:hypothetical protein
VPEVKSAQAGKRGRAKHAAGAGQEIEMNAMTKRFIAVVGLVVMATASLPVIAMAGGARLYEMTENMKIDSKGKFRRRDAISELFGAADVGTPLCPAALVAVYAPNAQSCTINATGIDSISLSTGLGPVSGWYTVVVQGDNNADSPEFVIARGTFSGSMDFSPAILMGIPLGHVTGTVTDVGTWKTVPFSGTFRLPFVVPVPDAALFSGLPLPLTPMDHYDVTRTTRPLYLLDDMQNMAPVEAREFGGGWATVRFEINF